MYIRDMSFTMNAMDVLSHYSHDIEMELLHREVKIFMHAQGHHI